MSLRISSQKMYASLGDINLGSWFTWITWLHGLYQDLLGNLEVILQENGPREDLLISKSVN